MSEEMVVIERDGAVGVLRLNREAKRNALDLHMRSAIASGVTELQGEVGIKVIVITGGNEVFAAGADLNLLVDKDAQGVADLDLGRYWAPLAQSSKPVIAAVSGFALGAGCELAMMCDFIVADGSARFGQPELKVGIMPGAGGTQRLMRAVGRPMASMLLLTGDLLSGERAWQLGMVAEFCEPGQAFERAKALARRIAAMPPLAVTATRRVLAQGGDMPLDAALALENREFLSLFDTQDQEEGMRAFLEKRTPSYIGR